MEFGNVNVFSANYPEALENFQTSKEVILANTEYVPDGISLDLVLRSIGEVFEHLGNYPEAVEYFNSS